MNVAKVCPKCGSSVFYKKNKINCHIQLSNLDRETFQLYKFSSMSWALFVLWTRTNFSTVRMFLLKFLRNLISLEQICVKIYLIIRINLKFFVNFVNMRPKQYNVL